ncbi:MAG: glycosyltransferase [Thermoleophilia bacterium]|nr:glycosyltransferase [Thermoleophilia bacterium]
MRVLVVSHLYPYPGVDRHLFVHEQCLALRGLGVEMHVISPTPWIPRVLWSSSRMRRRGSKPTRAVRDGIVADYPRFPQPPRRLLFDRLGDLAYRRVRGLPAVTGESYDLIHAHQALPDGAVAAHLSRDLGIPYLVTVHGADVNRGLEGAGPVARRTAEVLEGAAAVVAVSGVLARRLTARVPLDAVHVVQNGVPGALHGVPPTDYLPGHRVVLAAGRLVAGKGFEHVLEALARLADRRDDLRAVVAGEGALRRRLEALAAELGLADRVALPGRLEHEDLLAMMARADVFALPSAPEGFGLVHLEAMTQGTPVIGCLDQGPADFIEDGVSGHLVPYGDVAALTRALGATLDDPERARAVGEAGRKVAETFTWERNARRMLELYEQYVSAARPAGAA